MSEEELSEALALICGFIDVDVENEDIDLLDPNILIAVLVKLFPAKAQDFIKQIQKNNDEGHRWEKVVNFIQSTIMSGQKFNFEQFSQNEIVELYFLMADYLTQVFEQEQKAYLKEKERDLKQSKNKKQQIKPSRDNSKQKKEAPNIKRESKKKINQKVIVKEKTSKNKHDQPLQNQTLKSKQQKNKSKSKSKEKKSEPKVNKKIAKQLKGQQQQLQKQLVDQVRKVIEQKNFKSKSIKTNVLFRDEKSLEAVKAAKRKFDYYLQQFKNSKNKRVGKSANQLKKGKEQKEDLFLKVLEKKHKSIEEDMINQQIKYFMTLRDRKVAFVNKIHRLTQKLQRERLVDWTHQQRQVMLEERQKVKKRIEKADALFDKNMQVLRDQYKEMKENKAKMEVDEFVVCNQLQKAVAKRKCEQIELLKTLWEQQNSKLSNIIGDEQKIKNKLIDIYRKNRP